MPDPNEHQLPDSVRELASMLAKQRDWSLRDSVSPAQKERLNYEIKAKRSDALQSYPTDQHDLLFSFLSAGVFQALDASGGVLRQCWSDLAAANCLLDQAHEAQEALRVELTEAQQREAASSAAFRQLQNELSALRAQVPRQPVVPADQPPTWVGIFIAVVISVALAIGLVVLMPMVNPDIKPELQITYDLGKIIESLLVGATALIAGIAFGISALRRTTRPPEPPGASMIRRRRASGS